MADIKLTMENLTKNGFSVSYFETAKEAVEYLSGKIKGRSVGFGGSMTLKQIGLYEELSKANLVIWHWINSSAALSTRKCADNTDIYISSANAVAQTGEIVNIDGFGNRVANAFYGHEQYYHVVGVNKITTDLPSALDRAKNIAAPKNAQRLNAKTPCAVKGDKCYHCSAEAKVCRITTILEQKPIGVECSEVVIINEDLGY